MKSTGVMIQSVVRASQILDCFTGYQQEIGITELSKMMDLSKSTMFGLVNTLLNLGYLEQNQENKKYSLGIKLFTLGSLVQKRMDLRKIARDYLEQLSSEFQMTAHLGVYQSGEVIYMDKVDVPDARIIYSQLGKRAPMYCTGVGKAVLAFLPKQDQEVILSKEIVSFAPNTRTNQNDIEKELEQVKLQGYAVDDEEIEPGLRCIGAPIFNAERRVVGAISISAPMIYMPDEILPNIINRIKYISVAISKQLGYDEP